MAIRDYDYYTTVKDKRIIPGGILHTQIRRLRVLYPLIQSVTNALAAAGFQLERPSHTFESATTSSRSDRVTITSPVGIKPGLYILFGGAGAGKSTLLRGIFDSSFIRALTRSHFVGLKGGEPEYSSMVTSMGILKGLADEIKYRTSRNQTFSKELDGEVPLNLSADKYSNLVYAITIDSLANFTDYDVTSLVRPDDETLKEIRASASQVRGTGDDSALGTLAGDPVLLALRNPTIGFVPANNTKTTGLSGGLLHFITTLDAVCDRLGMYVFAILNAGTSDTPEIRSMIKGKVSGVVEFDSPDQSLFRVVPLMDDATYTAFAKACHSDSPVVPFTRMRAINGVRVSQGAIGEDPFADVRVPGIVGGE